MKRRILISAIIVSMVGISVILVALQSTVRQQNTVRIGALLALTGSGANYGKSLRQGIEMAAEEINQNGGINGNTLELVYEDSQGDAKTGISAFNKLASVDKVPLVIGSISSVILAVAPLADERHVVLVNSSAISPRIAERADNFLFSIMVSGAQEARFMAQEYALKHKDAPISVLYSNNSSGIDTKEVFLKELADVGGRIACAEGYELNSTDFRPQLTKIQASKAQSCYLIAFSSQEFARVLMQSRELGLHIQWYSYSGFETKETLDLAGTAAEGVIYSYPDYSNNAASIDAFQKRYEQRYGTWADIYTLTSYDGLHLLVQVMAKEGVTAEDIQSGLRKAGPYSGFFGELRFEDKQYVNKPLIWKLVKGGHYSLLTS